MTIEFNGELASYLTSGWEIVSVNVNSFDTYDATFLQTIRKANDVRVLGYSNFEKIDADTEEGFDPTPYNADFIKILSESK